MEDYAPAFIALGGVLIGLWVQARWKLRDEKREVYSDYLRDMTDWSKVVISAASRSQSTKLGWDDLAESVSRSSASYNLVVIIGPALVTQAATLASEAAGTRQANLEDEEWSNYAADARDVFAMSARYDLSSNWVQRFRRKYPVKWALKALHDRRAELMKRKDTDSRSGSASSGSRDS